MVFPLSVDRKIDAPALFKRYVDLDRWYSLHQPASIKFTGSSTIDPSMLYPLLLCIAAFYALFTCLLLVNMRVAILDRERRAAWVQRLAAEGG